MEKESSTSTVTSVRISNFKYKQLAKDWVKIRNYEKKILIGYL